MTATSMPSQAEIEVAVFETIAQLAATARKSGAAATRDTPLMETGLDSLALVTMVAQLQQRLGFDPFSRASEPFEPGSVGGLIDFYARNRPDGEELQPVPSTATLAPVSEPLQKDGTGVMRRRYTVDMPQMALGGLSEPWLARELGDLHWQMICNGLGARSRDLLDAEGRRCYATFTRLRYNLTDPLGSIEENATGSLTGKVSTFGRSFCFSRIDGAFDDTHLAGDCMTTFSSRERQGENDLIRSHPTNAFAPEVQRLGALPDFAQTYMRVRTALTEKTGVDFDTLGETIRIDDFETATFEHEYAVNPFTDINGANLLYFASYNVINDTAERAYIRSVDNTESSATLSTLGRDIFYFANAERDDTIRYALLGDSIGQNGARILTSALRNPRTGKIMALVVTRKARIA